MQTSLLFGIHCHQPVDNFSEVVDNAIAKSYRPFFEVVSKFDFKFSLHFSGWLLEYIKDNDKTLFSLMQELAKKGQIEFFSGGFYEPILASIPSRDRVEQIKKLNDFITFYFGQIPKGLWLTERVWDNSIIKDLIKCEIEYVVVDDYHLLSAGMNKDRLNGYYLTEDGGEIIKVFPINKQLRYILPFKEPNSVCEYLESLKESEGGAGIIFDDGEKFGLWPKTYEWVYEKKWLEKFLTQLSQTPSIKSSLFKEYTEEHKPLGLTYLPTTSYFEMGEWSLSEADAILIESLKEELAKTSFSEDDINRFVKGSIWKNFFVKYVEANHIHKRVLELSKSRDKVKDVNFDENLFKAQTNDVLWHGVFGGLYLPNLRDNAYRFIINAENIKYKESENIEVSDINFDGYDEVKVVSKSLISIFSEKLGGQMIEFDIRDKSFNLQNTLTRYKESYHDKILSPKEVGHREVEGIDTIHSIKVNDLDKYRVILKNDWYIKNSFIDHITDESFNIHNFENCNFREYSDFANQVFKLLKVNENVIEFERNGGVYTDKKYDMKLNKKFKVIDNFIEFEISLKSQTKFIENFFYLLEFNFHFPMLENIKINSKYITENLNFKTKTLIIEDNYLNKKILFEFESEAEILIYKVNSVSQSESGFDITNQAICFGFKFKYKPKFILKGKLEIL